MSLESLTAGMKQQVGEDCGLGKIVKFDMGSDGVIRVDATQKPNVVDNDNGPADCTIKVSMSDFEAISAGEQNPQMAFMMGKLKVEGDMSVAMQLGSILG